MKKKIHVTKFCYTPLSKLQGLMFAKSLQANQSFVLVNKSESIHNASIHMFFVFFPIDVIWLDKNYTVVDIKRNIKPFTFLLRPRKPAQYIVEVKANTTKGIKVNDTINLK